MKYITSFLLQVVTDDPIKESDAQDLSENLLRILDTEGGLNFSKVESLNKSIELSELAKIDTYAYYFDEYEENNIDYIKLS